MNAVNQFLADLASNPTVGAVGLAVAGALAGLWFAAAWWAFSDMSRRTTVEVGRLLAPAWILLSTPVLLPLSLGTYLLARPQRTVAERRAQRLFEALVPADDASGCAGCGLAVDPAWHRCPTCATWLASACRTCGDWSPVEMSLCPFCAHDKGARPARRGVVAAMAAAAAAQSVAVGQSAGLASSAAESAAASGIAGERQAPRPVEAGLVGADGLASALSLATAEDPDGDGSRTSGRPRSPRNRGARDLRRAGGADRYAGSGPVGIGS